ncbi:MAG: hypothetical protein NC124_02480 [Clostridium sp.]|nr:hypothetical protein [Clostridium sp.]
MEEFISVFGKTEEEITQKVSEKERVGWTVWSPISRHEVYGLYQTLSRKTVQSKKIESLTDLQKKVMKLFSSEFNIVFTEDVPLDEFIAALRKILNYRRSLKTVDQKRDFLLKVLRKGFDKLLPTKAVENHKRSQQAIKAADKKYAKERRKTKRDTHKKKDIITAKFSL